MSFLMHCLVSMSLVQLPLAWVAQASSAPTEAPIASAQSLQQTYDQAQALITAYRQTFDVIHLQRARPMLEHWIDQHTTLYGTQPAAESARTRVRRQIVEIDAVIAPPIQPSPTVEAAPSLPPPPDVHARAHTSARRKITGGAILLSLGAVAAATSLPLWAARDNRLDDARGERFSSERNRSVRRARLAHAGGWTTLGVGIAMMSGGLAMLVLGITRKAALRDVAVAPWVAPETAGLTAVGRF